MEYRKIIDNQINLLEDAMNYNPSEDHTGAKGRSLADLLNIVFKGNLPKISTLTKKKIIQYNIIASENSLVLYNQMKKQKFKRIFGKLKKAGYKGPGVVYVRLF